MKQRPTIITVLCIFGFIGITVGIATNIFFITDIGKHIFTTMGIGVPSQLSIVISLVMSIMILGSLISIWNMKKIGVVIYAVLVIINIIINRIYNNLKISGIIGSLVFIVLFFTKFKEME